MKAICKPRWAVSWAALLMLTSGCTTLMWPSKAHFVKSGPHNPVVEIMCLWQPGEGQDSQGHPTRGFAGQIMFFTRNEAQAAQVDGTVRIYVFDDVGTIEEQGRPIKEFELTSEQWNANLYESALGAKYQVFVPYTRPGGYQAYCAIRVQFNPADGGPPVFSRMASVELPGRRRPRSSTTNRPQLPQQKPMPEPTGVFKVTTRQVPELPLEGSLGPRQNFSTDWARLNAAARNAAEQVR